MQVDEVGDCIQKALEALKLVLENSSDLDLQEEAFELYLADEDGNPQLDKKALKRDAVINDFS